MEEEEEQILPLIELQVIYRQYGISRCKAKREAEEEQVCLYSLRAAKVFLVSTLYIAQLRLCYHTDRLTVGTLICLQEHFSIIGCL